VKRRLLESADSLGLDDNAQGRGLVDAERAVRGTGRAREPGEDHGIGC